MTHAESSIEITIVGKVSLEEVFSNLRDII